MLFETNELQGISGKFKNDVDDIDPKQWIKSY
jgi:hypothetical protein